MALISKSEKLILLKDTDGKNKAVIKDGILGAGGVIDPAKHVLSILLDAGSSEVITTVGTYTEVKTNALLNPTGFKWIQKALFVKDMEGAEVPISPGSSEKIKFKNGEPAIVYYDDDTTNGINGNGRPHFLKFMSDATLRKIGTTFVSDINKLKGQPDQAWYFVENMDGYEDYGLLESALVYKWSDTHLETWRSEESDYVDGDELTKLHNLALQTLAPGSTTPGAGSEAIYAWGDLSDSVQRKTFTDKAVEGQWGTATIGGVEYMFNVLDGDATAGIKITGFRTVTSPKGKSLEPANGLIKELAAPTVSAGVLMEDGKTFQQRIDESYLTGNYTSQVDNLKVTESLSDLTPGLKKDYTFPNGLTTDTVGGCEIAISSTVNGEVRTKTQGFDLRGWDKTKPLYLPVTFHSAATYIWVELKLEAVAGDNTKYSLTNYKSGAGSNEMNAFGAASIQFRGGQ